VPHLRHPRSSVQATARTGSVRFGPETSLALTDPGQVRSGMPERQTPDQRCRWEMFAAGEWQRCAKPRRHPGTHHIGTVTIGTRALIRLRMQRQPTVRRAKTR
jgi:hypothetical protein